MITQRSRPLPSHVPVTQSPAAWTHFLRVCSRQWTSHHLTGFSLGFPDTSLRYSTFFCPMSLCISKYILSLSHNILGTVFKELHATIKDISFLFCSFPLRIRNGSPWIVIWETITAADTCQYRRQGPFCEDKMTIQLHNTERQRAMENNNDASLRESLVPETWICKLKNTALCYICFCFPHYQSQFQAQSCSRILR